MKKVGIVGKNKLFSRRKTEKLCDSLFEDYEKSRKDKVWLDCQGDNQSQPQLYYNRTS